ncbi:MAG: PilZ domain-containing protein [Pseudoxanthomonas sp.]
MNDTRRAPRHSVRHPIPVSDAMTGETIGRMANISATGMLLVSASALVEDALYQLQFVLDNGSGRRTRIDVGAHVQWIGPANTPGQAWVGLRFLTVSDAHAERLRQWMTTLDALPGWP